MLLSEAAEGDGDGGASDAAVAALMLDGFEILDAAEARLPLKTEDCFSRYDDIVIWRKRAQAATVVS